jgi:hypothetical protein
MSAFCARQRRWNPLVFDARFLTGIEKLTKGMGSPKTADEADDSCRHESEREIVMCLLNKAVLVGTFAHEPGAGEEVLRTRGAARAASPPRSCTYKSALWQQEQS